METNGVDLFSVVPDGEAAAVKARKNTRKGVWTPAIAALGSGAVLRVRMKQDQVQSSLGRRVPVAYPGKRLTTSRTDDPEYTHVWLVDR